MRPDDSADQLIFFGALLVAAGVFLAKRGLQQLRHPVESTEEVRRNLEERGVPRLSVRIPSDPERWAPFIKWGAVHIVVAGSVIAAAGLLLAVVGMWQVVKWRL